MDKGFREYIESEAPDVVCLQETKAEREQVDLGWAEQMGYQHYWNSAEKRGYSGVCILSKPEPSKITLGMGLEEHDKEGRVITASYPGFHLVNVYTPNSQRGLKRLDYRRQWDAAFLSYVKKLKRRKPVVFCGDLNCAHQEIDLANPKANRKNAGFSEDERMGVDNIVAAGFVDTFREFDSEPGRYTWWTYRNDARKRNIGWRIDYFFVSKNLLDRVESASIRAEILGSDHCPVEMQIDDQASA